jgi:hypothetical protein
LENVDAYFQLFDLVYYREPNYKDFLACEPTVTLETLKQLYFKPAPETRREAAWEYMCRVFSQNQIQAVMDLETRIRLRELNHEVPLD